MDDPCRRLVRHLNLRGGDWREPERSGDGESCRLHSSSPDRATLEVRVVHELDRAPFWTSLARDRQVVWTGTASALAELVRQAIVRASADLPAGGEGRADTALLLVAGEAPPLTLTTVVEAFRSRHIGWSRTLGLHGIWIVGAGDDLVLRLDEREPTTGGEPAGGP